MSDSLENFCYNLGAATVTGKYSNAKFAKTKLKAKLEVKTNKKLASAFYALISTYTPNVKDPAHVVLHKVASVDEHEWNPFCDDVIGCCVKVAAPVIVPLASVAGTATAGLAGTTARIVPVIGSLGGGTSWGVEKMLHEDDLKTEQLKAQTIKYKILAAKLQRALNTHYAPENLI